MKNKKILKDIVINIVASLLPLMVLQLIILPIMAKNLDAGTNGMVISIVSLMALMGATFGNSLNNSRLLLNNDYVEENITGDFNFLWVLSLLCSVVISSVVLFLYYENIKGIAFIMVILGIVFILSKEYLSVEFRLNLNYIKVLINNLFLIAGYIIGLLIFKATNSVAWYAIYTLGYGFSLVYILSVGKLHRESLKPTKLIKKTFLNYFVLIIASFLLSAFSYIDRIMLYPLLSGEVVSIYNTATLFSKIISIGITPISGVLLSYFSKLKKEPDNFFNLVLLSSLGIGILGYFVGIFSSRIAIGILYPQFYVESIKYVPITTATAMVSMMCSIVDPFVLKFKPILWQIIISLVNLVIYLILSLVLMNIYGLTGFCVGILIANICKLFMMLVVYKTKSPVNA